MSAPLDLEPSLRRLATEIAAPLRKAIATMRRANLTDHAAAKVAREASGELVAGAFFAAGFPEAAPITGPFTARPLLASELTAAQRVLVEVYADIEEALSTELEQTPHLHGRKVPIPTRFTTLRRWIGAEPPTPLEEEHELDGHRWPLWRHACEADHEEVMAELVDTLPFEEGIAVLDALSHASGYGFDKVPGLYRTARLIKQIKGEGVPWARRQIESWVAAIATGPGAPNGGPEAFSFYERFAPGEP